VRLSSIVTVILVAVASTLIPSAALAADEKSEIGGTVYFDRNRDGSPGGGDPGLKGVQVSLTGPKGSRKDTTDAKGGYNFDGLPAGQYTITVTPPSGHQLTTSPSIQAKVDGKNAVRVVDFGIATQASTPTPTPSATSTAKASATPTPSATSTSTTSNTLQRPNAAGSPQPDVSVLEALDLALDEPADPAGSSTAVVGVTLTITPTATPNGGRGGIPDDVRLRAASLEPLRYAVGRDRLTAIKRYETGETIWLRVPFRTQMDGTYFSPVNCGPAALSMAMAAFGVDLDPSSIREYVNFLSGNVDPDSGTSLDHIARVAREAGLRTLDLYGARGYRAWDLDLVRQHVAQGHPVITLTRYQSLPGNANSNFFSDHYVVISGLSGDDFIYNDPSFGSSAGHGLLISGTDLERAWEFSSIPGHSLALAAGVDAQIPEWLRQRTETTAPPDESRPAEAEEDADMQTGDSLTEQETSKASVETAAETSLDSASLPGDTDQAFVASAETASIVTSEDIIDGGAVAAEAPKWALPAASQALVLPPADEASAARSVRLAGMFSLDPALVVMFLALLAMFLPPALGRYRARR
jgi:hypothetical protein